MRLSLAAAAPQAAGAEVATVACDVTHQESARQLVDAARERYGRLDILVNNAGGYEIFRDKAEGCLKVVLQP